MVRFLRSQKENLIYAGLFLLLFVTPVLNMYVRMAGDEHFVLDWDEIFDVWKIFLVYLGVFLIHNFFIAPLLIYKHKKALYFVIIAVLMTVFTVYQCTSRPKPGGHHGPHGGPRHEMFEKHHGPQEPPFDHHPSKEHRHPGKGHHHPPLFIGQADVIGVIVMFLLLGMNLAIKLYLKNERDRKQMQQLQTENLEHQLEYLKYQINPHFFMNTLNNIHALVDINPEQAKTSIVVLSKMMRYILYEGNNELIPLQREIAFINNYISLMRMRYTEKVRINIDMPQFVTTGEVPPLLLITFVENAFKHGISYQQESFIDIHIMTTDDQIIFLCRNSKAQEPNKEKGGVGLANVRKRLDLLYNDRYTLKYNDQPDSRPWRESDKTLSKSLSPQTTDTYEVDLRIPLKRGELKVESYKI